MKKSSVAVIVINWNTAKILKTSVDSLLAQSEPCDVIVVDNGSVDASREVIESYGEKVISLYNKKNKGFAGGANTGLRYVLHQDYEYVALLNTDAIADKHWVKNLRAVFSNKDVGGATCSMLTQDGKHYDSTGDQYTTWGLAYPRGRDEKTQGQYDDATEIFTISGGASMYRVETLRDVGLFDEDFFAYYEDVDLGFRIQLAGWKCLFVPEAIVHHMRGVTSKKIKVKDFTTYQTIKNLPWLFIKNVPLGLMPKMMPRFALAYSLFIVRALSRKQFQAVFKGLFIKTVFIPKKLWQRWHIMRTKKVSTAYIASMLTWDLPPNADALRSLRDRWHALLGKKQS